MNIMWRLILASALILGLASGCGGDETTSTESTGGTSGTEAVGGTDGNLVRPVIGDKGELTCTEGVLQKSNPPMCVVEASTLADAGDDASSNPADAGPTTPDSEADAASDCPDLAGRACPNRHNCTIQAVEDAECSFHCMNADGSENFGPTDSAESSRRLFQFCGMTQ